MPGAWSDYDSPGEASDAPLAHMARRLASDPAYYRRILGALRRVVERFDCVPERSVVLLEGARTWGRRQSSGEEVVTRDPTRHHGGPTRASRPDDPYHALPKVNRLVDRPPAEMGRPERRRRDSAGTAWVEAGRDEGACDVCRGAIPVGSLLYCDKCGASGYDKRLIELARAEIERTHDLEARGLMLDEDGLVVPIPAWG